MSELYADVADLLARPGARATRRGRVPIDASSAAVRPTDDAVELDLTLEHVTDGIVVHGTVSGTWQGACSRCLEPVSGPLSVTVRELFEKEAVEGETFPITDDAIDLELPLRDAIVLDLPTVPLCRSDCAGLCPSCGVNRNEEQCTCTGEHADPRWDALDELRL
ncbi:MAG: DUF177 domain-containing protein [Acidimicrobiia bacterium]|nr:DUF177 domain-containing protein [Acidimicrobiia bacterium]